MVLEGQMNLRKIGRDTVDRKDIDAYSSSLERA